MQKNSSLHESLASLPESERSKVLASLNESESYRVYWDWRGCAARAEQLAPGTPGAAIDRTDWRYWFVQAGRGWGKTRTGAEMVREWIRDFPYVNLIGATADDARDIMIEGESGIMACCPDRERPVYKSHLARLEWPNGAKSLIFTAVEPERLRGKQHMKLWADELGAWRYPEAWDQAMFGLRLGSNPQAVITTTPKPVDAVRRLLADPHTVVTRGRSYDNRANLAPAFFDAIVRKYEGTRLGRQELEAELLEDIPGALWSRKVIDDTRVSRDAVQQHWSRIVRIVIAVDPAISHEEDSDETGIIAAGLTHSRHAIVLADRSGQYTAQAWADQAIDAFLFYRADCIVAEKNQGGDLVEAAIRTAAEKRGLNPFAIPYKGIWAKRAKHLRAEPVSMLYEQGRVHHAGTFPALEDQMTNWTPMSGEASPDRLDALVYAITELLVDNTVIQLSAQFMQPVEVF